MENESETSKNSVDQIFIGEHQKTSLIFDLFRGLRVFSMEFFPDLWASFLVLLSHISYKNSEELPLACLYLKLSLGYGYPHLLLYKRVITMLCRSVINTGLSQKIA